MVTIALLGIPLKLVIVHRTMTGSEMAGALFGAGLWMVFRRIVRLGFTRAKLAAGAIALAALVAAGLVRFRFASEPQAFTWVPFLPTLQSPWDTAFVILLRKSFLYGGAVWLLHENARGWIVSALMVAISLAGVEATQIFLPGRTAEVTNPVLAVLLGGGLMLMERHAERRRRVPHARR